MRDDFDAECFLGNQYISGEGYVMAGEHGTYKLVDREVFSHYNFNIIRSWQQQLWGVDPPVYKTHREPNLQSVTEAR